ncbi:plastocyanin/azurin family copper-binding protein [Halorussus sp. MSC15.2]|uniref:plastocyanin/azurin family copper-binding protein n=1 Tax=Halorussus sp. MSC15.2 TaxID=2283638 RepID=UPI0013D3287B|nr:plastocyanin/azurin family copper-binding protein [Halorussus sp. MSC15.2]NEU55703.1 halocyanin [Halorussus sp. MSC15.2]
MLPDRRPDRRTVLKASGVALATGALSGCLGGVRGSLAGSETDDRDPSPDSTTDVEVADSETTTAASDATVTVAVGPGGRLAFDPSGDEPLVVAAGTTVEFVWESDTHNVVVDDQPDPADWAGSPGGTGTVYREGYSFSHTFEVPGIYEFHCAPHETVGGSGAIFVTPEGVAAEYATADDLPVTVGADHDQQFAPGTVRPLKVPVGTEVEFVWESDDHNVRVRDQPDTADWQGTPGDDSKLYNEGYEYSNTFEVPGVYWFYCLAHRSAGMVGAIVVEEQ